MERLWIAVFVWVIVALVIAIVSGVTENPWCLLAFAFPAFVTDSIVGEEHEQEL